MKQKTAGFDEHSVLHELKHYLPAQSPLKDFIHHNTLHSFQNLKFHHALRSASEILGYRVTLSLAEFRALYNAGHIKENVLERIIGQRVDSRSLPEWKEKILFKKFDNQPLPRVGSLRANWKRQYRIDLDSTVHPLLFRTLCSFLDQGISIWTFPVANMSFLDSVKELTRNSYSSFFRTDRAKKLLLNNQHDVKDLLAILVGDESLYEHYLYDQQFAHQGWSGMVSTVEDVPQTLLDKKQITLREVIIFELLLEIDALDFAFGADWKPLNSRLSDRPVAILSEVPEREYTQIIAIWQEAYEFTYYDEVLAGILSPRPPKPVVASKTFQSLFCIDDRECSLRRYLEKIDPSCETYGTPGFFTVEFYFQPENGKFYTKLCPWPVNPKYLIKEEGGRIRRQKDATFSKQSHSLFRGWLITQTLGFWSALKLFINIFRPTMGPATASSFKHMDRFATLTIENKNTADIENGLQIGFTVEEMAVRAESLLKSIGLVKDFAPLVYLVGHGSSSVNNPHYAAYDCGACSGRAGSVNSRTMCFMINHREVRKLLAQRGIAIPETTQFVGGLHDTTRDDVVFFDEDTLTPVNLENHKRNEGVFDKALDLNSKERSRRFESINSHHSPSSIHDDVRLRSVSLFEPRPELNHATNTLCIVGRRELTRNLFLDRRAFMNSYDCTIDPEGALLFGIMKPLGPVCGGINLEYFFSRVDNQKMGAGTKLPHNVMGLFGVANGIDGDLRPGLPSQMIEVHDPVRLLIIVEHKPDVILKTIQKDPAVYEWFINEWVRLVAIDPDTHALSLFDDGKFVAYAPLQTTVEKINDLTPILENNIENLPVYVLS